MTCVKTIMIENKNTFARIIKEDGGNFRINLFQKKYDAEEGVEYEIQIYPNPSSHFSDLDLAVIEAKQIIAGRDKSE